MATAIRNFTPKGRAVVGYKPITSHLTQGIRDPATGRVYKHPRVKLDNGLVAGGSVKIINRASLDSRKARRKGTIGINLVGDQTT